MKLRYYLLAGVVLAGMGAATPNSDLWQIDTTTTPNTVTLNYSGRTLTVQGGPNAGTIPVMGTVGNGIETAIQLRTLHATTIAGVPLAAAAGAGVLGYSISLGTSGMLISENANTNTKTDDALIMFTLPARYKAGTDLTVKSAVTTTGGGTPGTKTFQLKAYRLLTTGLTGADIGPGSSTAITSGDITSTITGTTLNPGEVVILNTHVVIQESGGTNLAVTVAPLRVS